MREHGNEIAKSATASGRTTFPVDTSAPGRGDAARTPDSTGQGAAIAHLTALTASVGSNSPQRSRSALQLQRLFGNRYVQRALELSRQADGSGVVATEVETSIERSRGNGAAMDAGTQRQMESAFGSEFSGVRIHTGPEAHELNRAVSAVAFTTGQDIFFRDGAYAPGTGSGKELLAHELTHVVQQGGASQKTGSAQRLEIQRMCSACEEEKSTTLQAKMTVGQADDAYEREAESTAKSVMGLLQQGSAPTEHAAAPVNQLNTLVTSEGSDDEIATLSPGDRSSISGVAQRGLIQADDDGASDGGALPGGVSDAGPSPVQTLDSCVPTARFTSIPSGTLTAGFGSGKFGASFSMGAQFGAPPAPCVPATCVNGEYRQFVRGVFKKNGVALTHQLCGNTMSPTTFYEDCATIGGTDYKYGYHSLAFGTSNFSNPDQATGCTFTGFDFPGFSAGGLATGDRVEVSLDFQGKLVDAGNSDKTLASSSWSVRGTGTAP